MGVRVFVYSQFNLSYVCYKPCFGTDGMGALVCTADDMTTDFPNAPARNFLNLPENYDPAKSNVQYLQAWSVQGAETAEEEFVHAHLISGGGDDTITGTADKF